MIAIESLIAPRQCRDDRAGNGGEGRHHDQRGHQGLVPPRPFLGMFPEARTPGLDRAFIEESPQVVGQVLRRGVSVRDVPGQRLEHDRLQVARDGRVPEARRFRLGKGHLVEKLIAVAAVVGRVEGQQLVERRAQRVDVGPVIDDPAAGRRLLGAHVPQRSEDVAGHRQAAVGLHARQAEIGDPEVAMHVNQQVGGLDVAVDDPLAMGIIEGLGGLQAQVGHGAEIGTAAGRGGGDGGVGRVGDLRPRRVGAPFRGARGFGLGNPAPAPRSMGWWPSRPGRDLDGQRTRRLGRHVAALQAREPAQVADQGGQGLALDVLHRVVMHAPLAADREDRHDIGVV